MVSTPNNKHYLTETLMDFNKMNSQTRWVKDLFQGEIQDPVDLSAVKAPCLSKTGQV